MYLVLYIQISNKSIFIFKNVSKLQHLLENLCFGSTLTQRKPFNLTLACLQFVDEADCSVVRTLKFLGRHFQIYLIGS